MRAYDLAVEMYESEEALNRIILKCSKVGGVFIDNDCLICGYPTHSSLIKTRSKKVLDVSDTWYIYLAVGDMEKAFSAFEKKDFIAFERFDGTNRLYPFDKVRRLLWAHQTSPQPQLPYQR